MVASCVKTLGSTRSPGFALVVSALLWCGAHAEGHRAEGEGACSPVGNSDDHFSSLQLALRMGEGNDTLQQQQKQELVTPDLAPAHAAPAPAPNPFARAAAAPPTPNPLGPDLSKFGDRFSAITQTVTMSLAWIRALVDGESNRTKINLLENFATAISATSGAMAYLLPPPANLAAAGALAGIGGVLDIYINPSNPSSNNDILNRMDESFQEVQARFDEQGQKLDSLLEMTEQIYDKLDDLVKLIEDNLELQLGDVKRLTRVAWTAEDFANKSVKLNTPRAAQTYKDYLVRQIIELVDFRGPGGPLSAENVKKAFELRGNCEAGMISSNIQAARIELYHMMMAESRLTGGSPEHQTLLRQELNRDLEKIKETMTNILHGQGGPGNVKNYMLRFEYPFDECERACVGESCVIKQNDLNLCLHLGSNASNTSGPEQAYLGNCTDPRTHRIAPMAKVRHYPNGQVAAISGEDEEGNTTYSCLAFAEGEETCGVNIEACVTVEACVNKTNDTSANDTNQTWDLDALGYLRPLSRKGDIISCVRPFPKTWGRVQVNFTIIEGRNLPKHDLFSQADGYVVCENIFGGTKARTRTAFDNPNPEWNHHYSWTRSQISPGAEMTKCCLWDANRGSQDKLVACWALDLDLDLGDHEIVVHPPKSGEVRFRYVVTQCPSGLLLSGPMDPELFKSDRRISKSSRPEFVGPSGTISWGNSGWQPGWLFERGEFENCPNLATGWAGLVMDAVVPLEIGFCSPGAEFALREEIS